MKPFAYSVEIGNFSILVVHHHSKPMKDKTIVRSIGHFDNEIAMDWLSKKYKERHYLNRKWIYQKKMAQEFLSHFI